MKLRKILICVMFFFKKHASKASSNANGFIIYLLFIFFFVKVVFLETFFVCRIATAMHKKACSCDCTSIHIQITYVAKTFDNLKTVLNFHRMFCL